MQLYVREVKGSSLGVGTGYPEKCSWICCVRADVQVYLCTLCALPLHQPAW